MPRPRKTECSACGGVDFTTKGECRPCKSIKVKEWKAKNKERVALHNKTYLENKSDEWKESRKLKSRLSVDPIKNRAKVSAWQKGNREHLNAKTRKRRQRLDVKLKDSEQTRRWRSENPDKARASVRKRQAKRLKATPFWLTDQQNSDILYFYSLARECELLTGDKYHVDHIIPLQGKNVCGLHVPWNLQVLPADINIKKGNKINAKFSEL